MKLEIAEEALQTMIKDAENAYPDECCGFFYGKEKDHRFIAVAVPVLNSKEGDKRRRFEISPEDYLKAERYALAHDLQLLGVYHSHPDHPARPSEHDLKQAVPYFSYIILSVQQGKAAHWTSWQLAEHGAFEEETIQGNNNKY